MSKASKYWMPHWSSYSHQAASEAARLCEQKSDKYPWVKTLRQHHEDSVNHLTGQWVGMHNDSLIESPASQSWSASSLPAFKCNSYSPSLVSVIGILILMVYIHMVLQRSSCALYNEMLHIICEFEMKKAVQTSSMAICITLQTTSSTYWQN
jgi:hypothetical protein